MPTLSFILNLPWFCLGLLLGLISVPQNSRLHHKPFALVFTVRSFWWQTWLPKYKGVRATTIGSVVLLGTRLLPKDLEHELVHVMQYKRAPFIHPFLYLLETLRHGYRANKYEVEAYRKAGNRYVEK